MPSASIFTCAKRPTAKKQKAKAKYFILKGSKDSVLQRHG